MNSSIIKNGTKKDKFLANILKFILEQFNVKPQNVQDFNEGTKRLSWSQLADTMKRSQGSLRQRVGLYTKSLLQSHMSGKDLIEMVTQMNPCIID